jgi:hypothetical protein
VTPRTEAARLRPENPTYRYHLAMAYSKSGDPTDAAAQLQLALTAPGAFADRPKVQSTKIRHQVPEDEIADLGPRCPELADVGDGKAHGLRRVEIEIADDRRQIVRIDQVIG